MLEFSTSQAREKKNSYGPNWSRLSCLEYSMRVKLEIKCTPDGL